MKIAIALLALALSGCMGTAGYGGMSAEQIKALGKEANISVIETASPWGKVRSVFINVDKSVVDKGGIEITQDGAVKFMNERQFSPPKIADPKLPPLPELKWSTP